MKKFGFTLLLMVLALSMTVDANAQRKKKKAKEDVEIVVPCSGAEFMGNDQFLRATGVALSSDMNVAKKKSMSAARSEIAMALESRVKTVSETFIESFQSGENDDTKQRFTELTLQSAKQTLKGVRVICNKFTKTPEGKYKSYVTLELTGQNVLDDIASAVMNDEKLKVDFEYEKFKEVFNEEMQNYANEN